MLKMYFVYIYIYNMYKSFYNIFLSIIKYYFMLLFINKYIRMFQNK